MIDHLYNAGLTTDGIILLSMLTVLALAWVANELGN